jgi:hypothetical protein
MNTADLLVSLRYVLNRETYSDYQIVDALNYVMNEISLALNNISSSLVHTSAELTLTNNEADFPSDLESIISVKDRVNVPLSYELDGYTYQIEGNKIKAQGNTVTVYYKKTLPTYSLSGETGAILPTTIDLPVGFNNMIKDSVIAIVTGNPVNIQVQAVKLAATRDGKKRPQKLIFKL